MGDDKKYSVMENVLNTINGKIISLEKEEIKMNNAILNPVRDQIINEMKKDSLFKFLYNRIFFGGSFYDNLKVGKPEEFDLDFVMVFPKIVEAKVEVSNLHGFVNARVKIPTTHEKFSDIQKLLDNGFLSTTKVFGWMQGVFQRTLNAFPKEEGKYVFSIELPNGTRKILYASLKVRAPAFTLLMTDKEKLNLDIDLVPCFEFGKENWPTGKYRKNTYKKETFLIVPKKPHANVNNLDRYWRLSFQEQEREIITSDENGRLKPTIRLLKKLRDQQVHEKIASYYIKTIFLWEVSNRQDNKEFWNKPLSFVFMTMLRKYAEMLTACKIPYFWNKEYNLLDHVSQVTIQGFGNRINRMIGDIDRNLNDPLLIGKYLMTKSELDELTLSNKLQQLQLQKKKKT